MKLKLLLALLAIFLISPVYADTQSGITTVNCGSTQNCPYGTYCSGASAYSIGTCTSLSGTQLPLCTSNADCSSGKVCAKDILKSQTYGSCVSCVEHWAAKVSGSSFCYQDSSNCGTQYNLPSNPSYPACQTQQQQGCVESWTCGAWTACQNGMQDRACTDVNGCGTVSRPALTQTCQVSSPPTPTSPTNIFTESQQIFNLNIPNWFLISLLLALVIGIAIWAVKKR